MSLFLQVIQINEIDEILDLENRKLQDSIADEVERSLQSWSARWRKEALEHYIPIGWCFSARDSEKKLLGYFIAQPILFLDGQAQSLWVEHMQFSSLVVRDALCELAYKLSREQHLQKVYFPNQLTIANAIASYKTEAWLPQSLQVKTTKT